MKIPEPIASFRTTITNKITSSAATILIDSVTDDDGVSMNGKILGFVIDKGKAEEEYILGTVDYSNSQLITVTRGLSVSDGATSTANNKFAHRKKASIEVSDHPYITLLARLMNGTDGVDPSYRPKLSSDVDTTDDKQFVTAAQLNRAAMSGVVSSRVLVAATAGETIAAGNLIYFKTSDGRWWLCDADTAATVDNVILGIAQGAGTAGNAITGGSLLWGVDSNQSARTLGAVQYASNTAGGISESVGTVEVTIGQAKSATEIYFYPRLNQQITEDQQDALAGSSGTPSATNKFVTANDTTVWDGSKVYAASVVGTDAYAATITGATLANGLTLRIKLDVANTGPATFNLNAGGALALVTGLSTPLVTGDYVANQIIEIVYNSTGTVWQVVTPPAQRGYSLGRAVAAESLTADRYVTFSSSAAMSATEPPGFIVPHAATIRKLYVRTGTISTNGTCVVTVRKNGVDTALTVSTNDTNSNATVSDLTNSFTVVAGDRLTIKLAYSTNTSEFCSFSVEVQPS